jgi:hypothetical protein
VRRFPFAHENLGPAGDRRDSLQVPRELNAVGNNIRRVDSRIVTAPDLRRRRPKGIGLTETIGHRLPNLLHYGEPIRSTKTLGRANVSLYLRNGLEGPPARWIDHKATWPKVNDPNQRHAARATLVKEIVGRREDGPTILVGHGPQAPNPRLPKATNAALVEAREEWVDITARLLRSYIRVIWLGDPNGLLDEVLVQLGDPKAARGGDATDAVLVRGFTIESAATPSNVNGIPMLTDHRKALLGVAVKR